MSAENHDKIYFKVFYALVGLTALTVAVSHINLGRPGNIGLAVLIAGFKVCVVGAFFMHLKDERGEMRNWTYAFVFFPFVLFGILVILLIPDVGMRVMAQN